MINITSHNILLKSVLEILETYFVFLFIVSWDSTRMVWFFIGIDAESTFIFFTEHIQILLWWPKKKAQSFVIYTQRHNARVATTSRCKLLWCMRTAFLSHNVRFYYKILIIMLLFIYSSYQLIIRIERLMWILYRVLKSQSTCK